MGSLGSKRGKRAPLCRVPDICEDFFSRVFVPHTRLTRGSERAGPPKQVRWFNGADSAG
jgi:hypothetical protein